MEHSDRIEQTASELSDKASELYNVINTLNFHSSQEAADDLRYSAGDLIRDMKQRVRYLHDALVGELGRGKLPAALEEELTDMNDFLDTLRHCSGESSSHHHLLDMLIPILKLLRKWADDGVEMPE